MYSRNLVIADITAYIASLRHAFPLRNRREKARLDVVVDRYNAGQRRKNVLCCNRGIPRVGRWGFPSISARFARGNLKKTTPHYNMKLCP